MLKALGTLIARKVITTLDITSLFVGVGVVVVVVVVVVGKGGGGGVIMPWHH